MSKKISLFILCLLALPVMNVAAYAQDEPDSVEETADPYYEACGEVEPFKDPSNQHSLQSIREDIGFIIEDIQKLMAGAPTGAALDKLSQNIESSCLAAATLPVEQKKKLDPNFKDMTHQYDELMTKVQEMEIPQTGSDE